MQRAKGGPRFDRDVSGRIDGSVQRAEGKVLTAPVEDSMLHGYYCPVLTSTLRCD